MKELLSKIGITEAGHFSDDGNYVIDFETSDQFNKAFSKLDKSELLDENEDASSITLETSTVLYEAEGFTLALVADFDQDAYKLVVTEIKE